MRDYYCTYEAEISSGTGPIADRVYRGEMDVRAKDKADAAKRLKAALLKSRPHDKLISCECKEFA